jgi:hypothetical protein
MTPDSPVAAARHRDHAAAAARWLRSGGRTCGHPQHAPNLFKRSPLPVGQAVAQLDDQPLALAQVIQRPSQVAPQELPRGHFSGAAKLGLALAFVNASASAAELYALLAALAKLPIKQGIAVTSSVNQHGDVQAIGRVNEKIEGFFDVCWALGLTGEQGVIVPHSNVQHRIGHTLSRPLGG